MKEYKIAVVGATGMVGRTFLKVLEEFKMPVSKYVLFASARSAGKKVQFMGKEYEIKELTENSFDEGFDFALFSAGGSISEKFVPLAAAKGCIAIDNSSMWRMNDDVPLVVPEVNPEALKHHKNIIANPNCSTIQAMLPLKAIKEAYGLKRVVCSTYQAVSGAGAAGYDDLADAAKAFANNEKHSMKKFAHPIFSNCLPHIDVFLDNGYTKEEWKMISETKKILNMPELPITVTAVRVPVLNGHSESINIQTERPFEIEDVKKVLAEFDDGMVVIDDPSNNKYPMPCDASGHNEVFVGRIRRDFSIENGLNLWCVADNIRKGAATNTVQIAKYMIEHNLV